MAYTGFYDAISLALSIKLFAFSAAAAFTDYWHPAFYQSEVSQNLVLIMAMVFMAMPLATINLVMMCLAIFVTEAVRTIASVMAGFCAFLYTMVLLVFSDNLVCLGSPWLLVMLVSPLCVVTAHQVLVHLKKLDNNPLYKFVLGCVMLPMCVLSISLSQWWADQFGRSPALTGTVGLFALPSTIGAKTLQACTILTVLLLLLLLAVWAIEFAVSKTWLTANPLGDAVSDYLGIGVSAAALLFAVTAVIGYCTLNRFTNSLLAAVSLSDAALCLIYQQFSSDTFAIDI